MAPSPAEIGAGLVAAALGAPDPAGGRTRIVAGVGAALRAAHTLLARAPHRWATPILTDEHATTGATRPLDLDDLGAAFDADGPVALGPASLALALRPRAEGLWCLAVTRSAPWTAAEHDTLAALSPYLTLVLEHTLLSEAAARGGHAGDTDATREHILATLSHELRNPLAPIVMWTSTLRHLRPDDAQVHQATRAIDRAVALVRRVIEDVSDLSRLERGTLTLHVEPLDLGALVRDVLAGERRLFGDAKLRLAEALPLQPVPIEGDPERLRQVVIHLVRNATRFTPAGGEVGVAVVPHPATVELRVSDSGPGLPASLLPHLFTPFTQGPNAHGGLGVGLAVTRGLVTLHRGTVEAIAHGERGGATVVVTLPGGAAPRYATGT